MSQAKNVCRAHVCVMDKLINILLDRQNFRCLQDSASSFGLGLMYQSFLNVTIPQVAIGNLANFLSGGQGFD